jgi:hypothetical protein
MKPITTISELHQTLSELGFKVNHNPNRVWALEHHVEGCTCSYDIETPNLEGEFGFTLETGYWGEGEMVTLYLSEALYGVDDRGHGYTVYVGSDDLMESYRLTKYVGAFPKEVYDLHQVIKSLTPSVLKEAKGVINYLNTQE